MRDPGRSMIYGVGAALAVSLTCLLPAFVENRATARVLVAVYVLGTVLLLVACLRGMRRASRMLGDYEAEMRGVCPGCGYDLRATRDRCPECGRDVSTPDVLPSDPALPPPQASDPPTHPDEPAPTRRAQ